MKKVASIVAIVVCALAIMTNQTELGIELGNAIACWDCWPDSIQIENVLACLDCWPSSIEIENALACWDCWPSNEAISSIA